jgi:hypothetical protein
MRCYFKRHFHRRLGVYLICDLITKNYWNWDTQNANSNPALFISKQPVKESALAVRVLFASKMKNSINSALAGKRRTE